VDFLRRYRGPGFWVVLAPKWQSALARIRRQRAESGPRGAVLLLLGLVFWGAAFAIVYRVLRHFKGVEEIGSVLAAKLLGLTFLAFGSILLLSNLITALSSFFLAKDLDFLASTPVHSVRFYFAKLLETMLHSSWMVALLAVPILTAYGIVYEGGPLYPLIALAAFLPFLTIPAVIGSACTLLLVTVVPAQRAKELLSLVAVGAAAALVLLFRVAQPEQLVRPEGFRSLAEFIAVLQAPTNPLLPTEWASRSIMNWLLRIGDPVPPALLWATAIGAAVGGAVLHRSIYRLAYSKAQESARVSAAPARWARWLGRALAWLPPDRREFLLKDTRLFFRDPTQWGQLILLGVLVVVYLFNIQALPLYSGERIPTAVVTLVVFLNLGLAGFVLAAIAARFLFPAVSLEGRQMWLLRSSPLDLRAMFWSKYWIGTAPLLVLALAITVVTNLILRASPFMMFVSVSTMVLFTLAASALALSFGAYYPRFDTENAAQIPTSFGGLIYMMASVLLLGLIISVEARGVAAVVRREQAGRPLDLGPDVVLPLLWVTLLCASVTLISLRLALARMRRIEL
jgi:ABC-2 type transport system permease protein